MGESSFEDDTRLETMGESSFELFESLDASDAVFCRRNDDRLSSFKELALIETFIGDDGPVVPGDRDELLDPPTTTAAAVVVVVDNAAVVVATVTAAVDSIVSVV